MASVTVRPAGEVPWADVERALTGGGDGGYCWCQWFLLPRKEFDATNRDEHRDLLRSEVATVRPSPGLVGYLDDEVAGWVRVGPRVAQGRLTATRPVRAGSPEPLDAPDVWAISCLVVRREARGRGVARELVAGAVGHAAAHGARVVEAYPWDPARRRSTGPNALFVGTTGMFAANGFRVTARPTEARVVMTLEVSESAGR